MTNFEKLGDSGLNISRIIVGCMSFGSKHWLDWVVEDEEKVFAILKKCYDAGLRTYDTADVYSNGESERLLGRFFKKYDIKRETVVIMTKVFNLHDADDITFGISQIPAALESPDFMNRRGLSRKYILDAAKKSVERLGTYIDLYQIHRYDPTTPMEETMRALNDVVESGLARYIGASTMRAVEFAQLQFIAEKKGYHKFVAMQNCYNLLYREEEREMIPFCQDNIFGKVHCIPWSPISRGVLARPLEADLDSERKGDFKLMKLVGYNVDVTQADSVIVKRVEEVAKKLKVSMANVATAWVLSKGHAPIVGINSVDRVEDTVRALDVQLSEEDIKYLEEPYVSKDNISR